MKETKHVLVCSTGVAIELNMPTTKKLRRLGPPAATFEYYFRLLSLMTGIPVEAIEEIDAVDLVKGVAAAYEVLRSYQAKRGLAIPSFPGSVGE